MEGRGWGHAVNFGRARGKGGWSRLAGQCQWRRGKRDSLNRCPSSPNSGGGGCGGGGGGGLVARFPPLSPLPPSSPPHTRGR